MENTKTQPNDSTETPYYVYDKQELDRQCKAISEIGLPDVSSVLYSLKANPNPHLVSRIVDNGLGCDVSSDFELSIALKSGVECSNIGCVGPHKSLSFLESCLRNNIAFIAVESIEELHDLARSKLSHASTTDIILRINPSIEIAGGSMKMGGAASQFGFSENDIPTALALAKRYKLKISGLHMYATTRVLDAEILLNNINTVIGHIDFLVSEYDIPTDIINLGGGFGIPYYKNETDLKLELIVDRLHLAQKALIDKHNVRRLFFESGRFVVGTCGKAVVKVCSIKLSKGKTFAVCDGGYNIFHGATAFGNLVRKAYMMEKQGTANQNEESDEKRKYTVVGPLCTPSDITNDKFECSELIVGDRIAINNVGAYSLTSSPGLFIGHGYPDEYLFDGTEYLKIGKKDTQESMLERYQVNPCRDTKVYDEKVIECA